MSTDFITEAAKNAAAANEARFAERLAKPVLKLFFFVQDSGDGDNLDHFVWAQDPQAALALWKENYDGLNDHDDLPRVMEVPLTPPAEPGLVEWDLQLIARPR